MVGSGDRTDDLDRWLPPKRYGSNTLRTLPRQSVPVTMTFYHDEVSGITSCLLPPQVDAMRNRMVPYKTYSMYHARGVFWTVSYNATERMVGDGKHDRADEGQDEEGGEDSSSESEEDESTAYDDWTELSFGEAEGQHSLSYAGRHLAKRRLLAQRREQDWVYHLIPDRYQWRTTSPDRRYGGLVGGLVGDLPLLIGLAAMSLPLRKWPTVLPQTIARSWQIPQSQKDEVDRGSACESFLVYDDRFHANISTGLEERGLVVKVFRDLHRTSERDLKDFEHGSFGPIFS